ncbi:MAG TPA: tRNA threonylcarbamoyladenosine dehydratase [Chitinophagales bacterium]|jgi:tRNA A37 threonylcarbamoyladenosine dehydratase|nr:tRNA threonylcarbamoyladenosine dehydratase [Chitinophagales bacterium]MBP6154794.1 tRNA threonylcarbamoyladenosine dehydratase [Chitinophagales bacterium]HQV76858.1 tRNA threonylcarbamoyladenosine dehydratase [Chitinophagales bacterium]HQW78075.1 tRNA threonylcarbamoyladenosine dehydratase [Chitinophagales bacterium]HRB67830.1 tRNA threonylcarbamoyladenosine dehydratase [Chitinophagales bacterium]
MQDKSWLSRTSILIGDEALEKLNNSHVLVVGLGGVGSYAAEFIARSGIGTMTIVDGDVVDPSNRNRQLPALASTHGISKADWMATRLKDINPELKLNVIKEFLTPEKAYEIVNQFEYDYIIDAIDSITPKLNLLKAAYRSQKKIIMSGGAGGKLDPTRLQVADISKTYNCVLVKLIRKRLRKEKIYKGIKVVFSDELPNRDSLILTDGTNFKRSAYGTISYLPAAFGGVSASVVIRDLIG